MKKYLDMSALISSMKEHFHNEHRKIFFNTSIKLFIFIEKMDIYNSRD